MINKVILVGHVGRDPEIKFTPSGQSVANFSVATTERYKDKGGNKQERTEWHSIVIWGPLTKVVQEYVKKGKLLYLEGKNVTREWEKGGVKHYRTDVVCSVMTMLGGGKKDGGAEESGVGDGGFPDETSEF